MKTRFQISSQRGHCLGVVRDALGSLGQVRAAVEMDLAARPARPGVGHAPEVLVVAGVDVAPARHALRREADLVPPDVPGDLVVRVRRGGQALARDSHVDGEELPRPVDRLALEVVAEAPVAHHLEERVVARRPADLLEVVVLPGHPQTALDVHGTGVAARLGAGEDLLELDHPRVGEQERLVAGRHEARARDDRVVALGEELEEPAADLRGGERNHARIGGRARRAEVGIAVMVANAAWRSRPGCARPPGQATAPIQRCRVTAAAAVAEGCGR